MLVPTVAATLDGLALIVASIVGNGGKSGEAHGFDGFVGCSGRLENTGESQIVENTTKHIEVRTRRVSDLDFI